MRAKGSRGLGVEVLWPRSLLVLADRSRWNALLGLACRGFAAARVRHLRKLSLDGAQERALFRGLARRCRRGGARGCAGRLATTMASVLFATRLGGSQAAVNLEHDKGGLEDDAASVLPAKWLALALSGVLLSLDQIACGTPVAKQRVQQLGPGLP